MPTKADGEAIRRLREDKGLTCSQLAKTLGYNDAFIWKIENGVQGGSPDSRRKIADFFGVSVADISRVVDRKPRTKRDLATQKAA
jgi:transcriptional regulator with XRE-family HTH domain